MEAIQQDVQDLTLRQQELRESVTVIRLRLREIATRLEERDKIVAELSRARAHLESVKKTLRDPSAIKEEINREKKVSTYPNIFFLKKI